MNRNELRAFVRWQIKEQLLAEPLTADYEVVDSYLETLENKVTNIKTYSQNRRTPTGENNI